MRSLQSLLLLLLLLLLLRQTGSGSHWHLLCMHAVRSLLSYRNALWSAYVTRLYHLTGKTHL
jgi:uncharacterized membrane protein